MPVAGTAPVPAPALAVVVVRPVVVSTLVSPWGAEGPALVTVREWVTVPFADTVAGPLW